MIYQSIGNLPRNMIKIKLIFFKNIKKQFILNLVKKINLTKKDEFLKKSEKKIFV
jgi:hypothetical protein